VLSHVVEQDCVSTPLFSLVMQVFTGHHQSACNVIPGDSDEALQRNVTREQGIRKYMKIILKSQGEQQTASTDICTS
jgi:hypothetical protein